jgi:hypothetical protein
MVNTQESPVILIDSAVVQAAPRDDTYIVQDGHFVGHDGFIVPNSFSEFYQRFPTYVADWVKRRVRGTASQTEAEDWTQELLMHLAALPACSKFRREGKEDVIQTFAPDRMHGANEARFRGFINRCLGNKHNTLYMKWIRRPLSNPGSLPFEADAEHGASDEFCHSNSEYLRQAGCRSREREEQRFRLGEFVRFGEASIPGLQIALESFHRTGSWDKTAEIFGRKKCESIRWRARQKGKAFTEGVRLASLNA